MTLLDDALAVLLDGRLEHVVEMALCARDGLIEAHAPDGSVWLEPDGTVARVRGRDPLARADAAAFSPLREELRALRPPRTANSYPHAYEHVAQLFRHPCAPDVAVVHTGAHNWEERGGHRGEHGSLGVIQARAPFLAAGAGVARAGAIARSARMVDVAPTVAALLGLAPPRGAEGAAIAEVLDDRERPDRVVVFLWDGTNANELHAMAEAGELPAVARLRASGSWLEHGLIASFPSVTLANHATAITGLHPGSHGILHNEYYDRARRRRVLTNAPDVWHLAREELRPEAETLFEAVARAGGTTAAVNEPVDRGAGYATFDLLRRGEVASVASALGEAGVARTTPGMAEAKREYGWASAADELAVRQAVEVASGARPRLLWVNLILPDAAAHLGGPHSEMARAGLRDTDARMGAILDATGWDERTAYVLIADHGMEESDPECRGDWDDALAAAGIRFRDEGYGFVYLGEGA